MKPKRVLKKQVVKRKKGRTLSALWKGICLMGTCFLKLSVLVGALVMISLFFVSVYGWLLSSPFTRLDRVIVSGVNKEIKKELLDMADLNQDLSLLAVNLSELKSKLEGHPWVRSVDLEKRFPHTLVIRAEKERPWALVYMDRLYYLNREGTIFKEVDRTGELDYPVITGIIGETKTEQLHCALHVLGTLEKEKGALSLEDLSEIHVRQDGQVALYFSSLPAVVKLGGGDLERRMENLKRLVDHLNNTGRVRMVKGINLNYSDGAVVSLRKG